MKTEEIVDRHDYYRGDRDCDPLLHIEITEGMMITETCVKKENAK